MRTPPPATQRGPSDLRQRRRGAADRQGAQGPREPPGAGRGQEAPQACRREPSHARTSLTSGPHTPAVSCISAFVTASRQPAPRPSLPSNRLLWSHIPGTGEPRAGEPEALLSPEALSVLTRVPVFSASTKFPFFSTPHSNDSATQGRIFFLIGFKIHSKIEWNVQRFLHVSKMQSISSSPRRIHSRLPWCLRR